MDKRVHPKPTRIDWPKQSFREGQLVRIGEKIYRISQIAKSGGEFQITLSPEGSIHDATD